MIYTTLPTTDIKVSKICLGTMTWGEQNTQDEAFEQLDVDNSGAISAEEASALEGLQEAIADYDLNGDKQLDKEEFAQFVQTMEAKTAS